MTAVSLDPRSASTIPAARSRRATATTLPGSPVLAARAPMAPQGVGRRARPIHGGGAAPAQAALHLTRRGEIVATSAIGLVFASGLSTVIYQFLMISAS